MVYETGRHGKKKSAGFKELLHRVKRQVLAYGMAARICEEIKAGKNFCLALQSVAKIKKICKLSFGIYAPFGESQRRAIRPGRGAGEKQV
ncbi:hypothetical protein [Nafulsella turpanensis]|uniref:hypothetical protein n=1 Tax=Nafulsella turpanensis TaxID=1265690 RepID=UPI00037F5AC9|nr:hypothetical protein [Nafulsella turpanensis]